MKKICFVIQRYGEDVNGGAELLCRQMAERLSAYYEVSVLTSCARDYITWKNEYPAGEESINGIRVYRFSAVQERDREKTDRMNANFWRQVFCKADQEREWLIAQGPYCPGLLEEVRRRKDETDAFLFFTYLYWTTVAVLPEVKEKAILIPTAHDEPFIYMNIMRPVFRECAGIIYLTEAEKRLVQRIFANENVPHITGGSGIVIPEHTNAQPLKEKYGTDHYIVYVGRVDEGKQVPVLCRYFQEYRKRTGRDLKLVLCGKQFIELPEDDAILPLGFVSEQEKFDWIAGALCLVLPSRWESLSLVVLEAMALGVPAVVNAACEVTKDHCILSNGGLYYSSYWEFEGILDRLLDRPQEREEIGRCGAAYVREMYSWDAVLKQIRSLIEEHV